MENSLLNLLPTEVRLAIYEEVMFVDTVTVTLNKEKTAMRAESDKKHLLAIRATCKEIYNETEDIIFKVNDKWRFSHPDDNTRDWGKRVQKWCSSKASARALRRTKAVQFDMGTWLTSSKGPQIQHPGRQAIREISCMLSELPAALKRPSIEQTIRLELDWSDGITLGPNRKDRFDNLTLTVPMWKPRREILFGLGLQITSHDREAHAAFRRCTNCWVTGEDGEVYNVPFLYPPTALYQGPRLYRELRTARELATALKFRFAEFFCDEMINVWEMARETVDLIHVNPHTWD